MRAPPPAGVTTRASSTPARWRRRAGEPWTSPGGSRSPASARAGRRRAPGVRAPPLQRGFGAWRADRPAPTPKNTRRELGRAPRRRRARARRARPARSRRGVAPAPRTPSASPGAREGPSPRSPAPRARGPSCRSRGRTRRRRRRASAPAPDADRRLQRDRARRQLGGGIGQREAAAERPPRADRGVADVRHRRREQRRVLAHQRRALHRLVPGERADHQPLGVRRMASRPGRRLMSITARGVARRMLSAGTRLWPPARMSPVVAVAIEEIEGLGERRGPVILERGGFHGGNERKVRRSDARAAGPGGAKGSTTGVAPVRAKARDLRAAGLGRAHRAEPVEHALEIPFTAPARSPAFHARVHRLDLLGEAALVEEARVDARRWHSR